MEENQTCVLKLHVYEETLSNVIYNTSLKALSVSSLYELWNNKFDINIVSQSEFTAFSDTQNLCCT